MVSRYLARLITNLLCIILIPAMVYAVQQEAKLKGKLVDPSGSPITEATLILSTAKGTQVAQTTVNSDGTFELGVLTGNYVLQVDAKGWSQQRLAVNLNDNPEVDLNVQVSASPVEDQVTVTASAGEALEIFEYPRAISTASAEEMRRRPVAMLPQALREEPGIHVQQTTASQGSVFMRGLTGQRSCFS
ncbi:MAG: carboxypeptidase regulatory-like domain-containing protein [Blastocatellia bacterium]|nr:carboxypeptidase regulatory-like domain-containing protein [Blastocatellia bacterium]